MRSRTVVLTLLLSVAVVGVGALTLQAANEPKVPYPTGWRGWTHVKTMAITSDQHPLFAAFGGIHHIYVNSTGLKAAKSGGAYPDGSVLVFDLLEWTESGGAYTEGARKLIGVMHKDSKKYKDTGGWGFEGFKAGDPKERLVNDPVSQCYNCHAGQKDKDFVFSQYRE
ncbi:MAG: cytochrome P460 family protein [Candidatus Binatia bacterium]|nr:cytochrome P460 family protein [Candidatus Binatia bacterium]